MVSLSNHIVILIIFEMNLFKMRILVFLTLHDSLQLLTLSKPKCLASCIFVLLFFEMSDIDSCRRPVFNSTLHFFLSCPIWNQGCIVLTIGCSSY